MMRLIRRRYWMLGVLAGTLAMLGLWRPRRRWAVRQRAAFDRCPHAEMAGAHDEPKLAAIRAAGM